MNSRVTCGWSTESGTHATVSADANTDFNKIVNYFKEMLEKSGLSEDEKKLVHLSIGVMPDLDSSNDHIEHKIKLKTWHAYETNTQEFRDFVDSTARGFVKIIDGIEPRD